MVKIDKMPNEPTPQLRKNRHRRRKPSLKPFPIEGAFFAAVKLWNCQICCLPASRAPGRLKVREAF